VREDSDWPDLTLQGDMRIMKGDAFGQRIRRGERIVGVNSVPNAMFDGCAERQCQRNHGGQTLMEVRQRGGVDAVEALCILSSQGFEGMRGLTEEAAHRVLYSMVVMFNRGQRVSEQKTAEK
jgi:hypothetical protein